MIYPKELEAKVLSNKEFKSYIPKKISKNEQLKVFHKYWLMEEKSPFKVENSYKIMHHEYYDVKFIYNKKYGLLSFPIDPSAYELIADRNNIRDLDSIINTNKSYYGSEIKYWFYTHNIDMNSERYYGFKQYIELGENSVLSDTKLYFLLADEKDGIYYNCKIICENSR